MGEATTDFDRLSKSHPVKIYITYACLSDGSASTHEMNLVGLWSKIVVSSGVISDN